MAADYPRVTVTEEKSYYRDSFSSGFYHPVAVMLPAALSIACSRGTLELTRVFPQFTVVQSVLVSDFLPKENAKLSVKFHLLIEPHDSFFVVGKQCES